MAEAKAVPSAPAPCSPATSGRDEMATGWGAEMAFGEATFQRPGLFCGRRQRRAQAGLVPIEKRSELSKASSPAAGAGLAGAVRTAGLRDSSPLCRDKSSPRPEPAEAGALQTQVPSWRGTGRPSSQRLWRSPFHRGQEVP